MVEKICEGMLVHKVREVTGGLIDDEQGEVQSRDGVCRSDLHPKADR